MNKPSFSASTALSAAFATFKQNSSYCLVFLSAIEIVSLVAAASLAMNTCAVVQLLTQLDCLPPETFPCVFIAYFIVLRCLMNVVVCKVFLLLSEGKKVTVDDVLGFDVPYHLPLMLKYFASALVFFVYATLGTILFVLPGIFVTSTLRFYKFMVVDRDADSIQGLKDSYELGLSCKGELVSFNIMTALLKLAGLACLVVGLVPATAICTLAEAHAYRILGGAAD